MTLSRIELFAMKMREALSSPLPGAEAQFTMAPEGRKEIYPDLSLLKGHKESAVCIHFHERNNRICFPVIERVESKGVHSKQMALPGGRKDLQDEDFISCAIRETHEETGIDIQRNQVLGKLTALYIPPSNYLVEPVISYQVDVPQWIINKKEVVRIYDFHLSELMNEGIVVQEKVSDRYGAQRSVPGFQLDGRLIWGATAMILAELKTLIQNNKNLSSINW